MTKVCSNVYELMDDINNRFKRKIENMSETNPQCVKKNGCSNAEMVTMENDEIKQKRHKTNIANQVKPEVEIDQTCENIQI